MLLKRFFQNIRFLLLWARHDLTINWITKKKSRPDTLRLNILALRNIEFYFFSHNFYNNYNYIFFIIILGMHTYQVFYLECLFILLPKTKRNVFSLYTDILIIFLILLFKNSFFRNKTILFCILFSEKKVIGCEIKVSFISSEQL